MSEATAPGGTNPTVFVGGVVAVAAALSALVAFVVEPQVFGHVGRGMGPGTGPGMGSGQESGTFTDLRLFVSTFNVLVLLVLTGTYLSVYRDLPNPFTLSLLLFSVALLLYALASNPAVHVLFGYRTGPEIGPFAFLPDLFAAVAVTVLLYQSYQ
ncbi:MAG: hypothetical protein V5A34_00810 [Halapricum sp.]|jgi:hypothetical protein